MDTQKKFKYRLIAARLQQKLTQTDLAAKSGLQPSAISHFESGRRIPSFKNLCLLADTLKISLDYLTGRD
jgi:transcriptional regulator with XRE-family HTH domain